MFGCYCQTPGDNLDDLNSDTYKGWVVVSRTRLEGLKTRIFQVCPGKLLTGRGDGGYLEHW